MKMTKFAMIGTFALALVFAAAAIGSVNSLLSSSALAQSILIDDFDDGNDDGWAHSSSGVSAAAAPAVWDASQQHYNLQTTGLVGIGEFGGVSSFWSESVNPQYQHGLLRAKVTANTDGTTVGLALRSDGTLETGYQFVGSTQGNLFNIWRGINDNFTLLGSINTPFQVGEEWFIEAGAVEDELSMKVWKVGDDEPQEPQFRTRDATLTSGVFGVGTGISTGWNSLAMTNATIDDVHFTPIPEPSTATLSAIFFAGIFVRQWRRR